MKNKLQIKKYNSIFEKLGIKKNDTVLVNSNILNFFLQKNNIFNPQELIDSLIKKISSKGTLIFPTFSWEFCDKKFFDYNLTKSVCGSLSNLTLLNKRDFKRTLNPIFSFTVFGKNRDKLIKMKHSNSFSLNSPFGYMIKNKAKNLFIDLDYKDAMTFVHVAEQAERVSYRYEKTFSGTYVDKLNKRKKKFFKMFVRKKNVNSTIIDKKFDKILEDQKAIRKIQNNKISFSILDINVTYGLMRKEIQKKSGLIHYV